MTQAKKQHAQFARVIDSVKQHSTELLKVSETMDLKRFDQALHDEWFMIDARGQRVTKQEELALLRSSDFKPSSLQVEEIYVELHGDTAIVAGISNVKATYQGKDMSGRYRFTQIYKAQGGQDLLDHAAKNLSAASALPSDFAMVACVSMAL